MGTKISFQRVVQAVKAPTFVGFSIVSAALTMLLYWNSGSSTLDRAILGITAFSLEGLKLYALLMGNIYFDYIRLEAKETKNTFYRLLRIDEVCKSLFKKGTLMYFTYFLAAAVSIFGSYNFTLSTIDRSVRQNISAQGITLTPEEIKLTSEISFLSKEIERLESKIKSDSADYLALPSDFITAKNRVQAKIDADSKVLSEYTIKKNENEYSLALLQANKEASVVQIKKSSFQIMAENLSTEERPLTAQQILAVLLLITSLLIEMGVVVTSPHEDTFNVFERVTSHNKKKVEEDPLIEIKEFEPPKLRKKYTKRSNDELPSKNIEEAAAKASEVFKASLNDSVTTSDKTTTEVILVEKPSRVEVRQISPIHKFLKDILPEDGKAGFLRKENIESSGLPTIQAKEIFNNLARSKGPSGYPIFEFRKDHGKWYANYSLNDIITIMDKAS